MSEAVKIYEQLLRKLHHLIANGLGSSKEADEIRDQMDEPLLTQDEEEQMDQLSVYLYQLNRQPQSMVLKISFDLHGVANEKPDICPEFFSSLSKLLVDNGHEVYVMTGSRDSDDLRNELRELGIHFTHILSVTSYLESQPGVKMKYDEHGNPNVDDVTWDKVKGDLARKYGLHLHFEDTDSYLEHFTTPVARYWSKDKPKMKRLKAYGKPPVKVNDPETVATRLVGPKRAIASR